MKNAPGARMSPPRNRDEDHGQTGQEYNLHGGRWGGAGWTGACRRRSVQASQPVLWARAEFSRCSPKFFCQLLKVSFLHEKASVSTKSLRKALAFLFFPSLSSQFFPVLGGRSFYHSPERSEGRKTNQELKESCRKPSGAGERVLLTREQLLLCLASILFNG